MHLALTKNDTHTYSQSQALIRLVALCQQVPTACLLVSNDSNAEFDFLLAYDSYASLSTNTQCLSQLQSFYELHNGYVFGHLGYDIKNEIENLSSTNPDYQGFEALHFFSPKIIIKIKNNIVTFMYSTETIIAPIIEQFYSPTCNLSNTPTTQCNLQCSTTKDEYVTKVNAIKKHIQRGDIYITNYCINYVSEHTTINPYQKFIQINTLSNAPFASFYKYDNKYVLCASPELYIKRIANKVISMPIKGTRKRGDTPALDAAIANELAHNAKEQNENVMIVDLVRNDLAQVAMRGSVAVQELFKVRTFNAVHQLISTITCTVATTETPTRIIKATFPMGSMTGAPKISAMQLMENFENFKRGIYSGAIGYIAPNGNFNFNVVIRSIIYNATTHTVSLPVGSAITNKCNPTDEYEECQLKAKALLDIMR